MYFTLLIFKLWQNNFHKKLPQYQITRVVHPQTSNLAEIFTSEFMLPDSKKFFDALVQTVVDAVNVMTHGRFHQRQKPNTSQLEPNTGEMVSRSGIYSQQTERKTFYLLRKLGLDEDNQTILCAKMHLCKFIRLFTCSTLSVYINILKCLEYKKKKTNKQTKNI